MHPFSFSTRACLVLAVSALFSLAGQRLRAEPEPEEIKTLADFTLSYVSGTSLHSWSASVTGTLQPDGKLALEMKRSQPNRRARDQWTAVASPELKGHLLDYVGEQWRKRQQREEKIIEKGNLVPDAAKSPEQAVEDRRHARQIYEREQEAQRGDGAAQAALSVSFTDSDPRVIRILVNTESANTLVGEVYAATRDKNAQKTDIERAEVQLRKEPMGLETGDEERRQERRRYEMMQDERRREQKDYERKMEELRRTMREVPRPPLAWRIQSKKRLSVSDCERLFLSKVDLPGGFKITEDNRGRSPGGDDKLYAELGGSYGGFTVWMAPDAKSSIGRIVDLRWVFPSETAARVYLEKSLTVLAEGMDPVPGALKVGDETYIFGPGIKASRLGLNAPMFSVVFRKGIVVAKLFVAQGAESNMDLEPKLIIPLTEKITALIWKWTPSECMEKPLKEKN